MPEIKHNFTKGKMNKDLDERLVPNGEYRDAMNIQVSTSEGGDVGTVQNILGNSIVSGQEFISGDSICVGSVSDEKNDKLYYFISRKEILQGNNFIDNTYWESSPSVTDIYNGDSVSLTSSGGSSTTPNYPSWRQKFDLIDGNTYKLKVKFSDIDNGGTAASKFFMVGREEGSTNYRPYYSQSYSNVPINTHNSSYTNIFTFDQALNNDSTKMGFYVEMVNGSTFVKKIKVDSVSLHNLANSDYIIEYDSKTNSITPVVVDNTGEVLQFSSNRLITGINIIDDMLFWTDNHSEPKKINIPRSIKGTDSSGLVHTQFINEKTGFQENLKEEHITVIKKSPPTSPTVVLESERDATGTHTGVMLITKTSPFSGNTNVMEIDVTEEQIALWENGTLIQNAMPHLTPDEREFIKTGITSEEWDSAFK